MALDPRDRPSITAFVRREGRGVVATVTQQGRPEAALVGLAALPDGTLIFNSEVKARKIQNLAANDLVAVVVGVGGDVSVQFEGTATITDSEERQAYGSAYDRQFPGSRALHDDFTVVAVHPSWVRVYDASSAPAVVTEADWSPATR